MAHLTFHGAARQVTGSCHLLETEGGRMPVPQGPGIGVTLDLDYLKTATLSVQDFVA